MSYGEPISYLPRSAEFIESHLDAFQDNLSMFRIALGKPHALDDETLELSLNRYRQRLDEARTPENQLEQWLREPLTAAQRSEVKRQMLRMQRWREQCQELIELIGELLRQNARIPEKKRDRKLAAAFNIETQCRHFQTLSAQSRAGLPFVLPAEVTVEPRHSHDKIFYAFQHAKLGFLGELVVDNAPGGVTIDSWVNNQQDERSADVRKQRREQRRELFVSLTARLLSGLHGVEIRSVADRITSEEKSEQKSPENWTTKFTTEQLQLASLIDRKARELMGSGVDDEIMMLVAMADCMPDFKKIIDTATPEMMDELCRRFDGFQAYAKTLAAIAKGIQSGEIQVPK